MSKFNLFEGGSPLKGMEEELEIKKGEKGAGFKPLERGGGGGEEGEKIFINKIKNVLEQIDKKIQKKEIDLSAIFKTPREKQILIYQIVPALRSSMFETVSREFSSLNSTVSSFIEDTSKLFLDADLDYNKGFGTSNYEKVGEIEKTLDSINENEKKQAEEIVAKLLIDDNKLGEFIKWAAYGVEKIEKNYITDEEKEKREGVLKNKGQYYETSSFDVEHLTMRAESLQDEIAFQTQTINAAHAIAQVFLRAVKKVGERRGEEIKDILTIPENLEYKY